MFGKNRSAEEFANGLVLAYVVKVMLAGYAIAHHEYGFRLPSLPLDIAYVIQAF